MSVCRSCLISNWRDSKRIQRSSTLHDSESEIVEMVQYINCECAHSVSFCHIYGTLSSDTVIMEGIDLAIRKQGVNDLGDLKLGRLYMWCQFLGPVNLNWEAKVVGRIGNNNFLPYIRRRVCFKTYHSIVGCVFSIPSMLYFQHLKNSLAEMVQIQPVPSSLLVCDTLEMII